MPQKRDKTTGLPFPNPVNPGSVQYLCLPIPDHTLYRQALKGALSELGKPWNWSQTVGEDNQGAYEAAELWRSMIANAVYTDDCGAGSMSCLDVANCITTNPLVAQAIAQAIANNPDLAQAISDLIGGVYFPGTENTPGQPLDPGKWSENLTPTEDCNFNVFWAQMEQFTDYLINLGQDTLDYIAFYNQGLEGAQNVPLGGFLGKLKNGTTAGKAVEFIQWAANTMKGAYEAADNASNRDAIKCAFFCAGKEADCTMSLAVAFDVLNARLGGALDPGAINTLPELADAALTLVSNPSLALDAWLAFLLTSARVAGFLGLEGIDETMALVLAVAVNDGNNDWTIKCDDCNAPEENCMSMADFVIPPGGWGEKFGGSIAAKKFDPGDQKFYLKAYLPKGWLEEADHIYEARFSFSRPVTNVRLSTTSGAALAEYTGAALNEITFNLSNRIGSVDYPWYVGTGPTGLSLQIHFKNDLGQDTAVSVTQFCYEIIPGA